jgi:hypothetical protein
MNVHHEGHEEHEEKPNQLHPAIQIFVSFVLFVVKLSCPALPLRALGVRPCLCSLMLRVH